MAATQAEPKQPLRTLKHHLCASPLHSSTLPRLYDSPGPQTFCKRAGMGLDGGTISA